MALSGLLPPHQLKNNERAILVHGKDINRPGGRGELDSISPGWIYKQL
jgi:hypothetical protein